MEENQIVNPCGVIYNYIAISRDVANFQLEVNLWLKSNNHNVIFTAMLANGKLIEFKLLEPVSSKIDEVKNINSWEIEIENFSIYKKWISQFMEIMNFYIHKSQNASFTVPYGYGISVVNNTANTKLGTPITTGIMDNEIRGHQ